jgi:hypothetical protein
MEYPISRYKGKSFLWAFLLFLLMFTAAAFWGRPLGLSRDAAAALIGISGFTPLTIQLVTGYGLDSTWTTRFGRKEDPLLFWTTLAVSILLAVWFSVFALKMI